jgi:hypothetical protein
MISRLRLLPLAVLVVCIVVLAPTDRLGHAQPKPPDLKPNPAAPTVKTAFPVGGQRGTTFDITFVGTNLAEPIKLWTSFPAAAGTIVFPTEGNNGKDATKLIARITLPPEAPLGFHGVRVVTSKGVSNLRLFCIDDLPQVLADGKNGTLETAQKVPIPCCVAGRIDNEGKAYFKIPVTAGQSLSFEVLGRRLGSAFDPQLTLFDLKGRELPGGYSNDAPGRQTDPALRYTFKDAGEYLVEVRDVGFKGGEDFFYRLRIGDFPLATTPIPLAAKRGSKVQVSFAGPFTTGVAPVEVTVPADPFTEEIAVAPKGASGQHGWPVILSVSDLEEVVEQEPNNEAAKANKVPVPGAVSGRFETRGDVDFYSFAGKKGQKLVLDAQSVEVGSPTEVILTVRDAKGGQVGASDPMKGPRVEFTPADDGNFTVQVEHLHYWGGPSESYRVTILPAEPGFDLSVALDRFEIRPGTTLNIPVTVARRDNPGEITVKVDGVPGLSGEVKVPAANPPPFVLLPIKAADDLTGGPTTFRIIGTLTANGKTITETASVRGSLSGQLAGLPLPPRPLTKQIGLFVLEPPPFLLTAKLNMAETMPGKNVDLTVTAERRGGFAGEIALTVTGLPANTKAETKNIPANMKDVTFPITVPANAAVGMATLTVQGKAMHAGKEVVMTSPGVPLNVKK